MQKYSRTGNDESREQVSPINYFFKGNLARLKIKILAKSTNLNIFWNHWTDLKIFKS